MILAMYVAAICTYFAISAHVGIVPKIGNSQKHNERNEYVYVRTYVFVYANVNALCIYLCIYVCTGVCVNVCM